MASLLKRLSIVQKNERANPTAAKSQERTPSENRTRVSPVAGEYSTTRPMVSHRLFIAEN